MSTSRLPLWLFIGGIAALFISHDLRNVKRYADQVTVMREGQLMETGNTLPLLNNPKQPYTRRLIEAIPSLRPSMKSVHESI
ncbi:ABC-type dipeptide/oligopeptide/nickel transport system ATPase component [Paenibacillus sp. RC254]|uniref:ABC transporter ATP-binding protein n=1 Tax=unclassified Paenibacillus TaxID=185978 RepID=UPI0024BBBACA|nr:MULTISPECIES: hypothetical protein [unclassified Paenibacillus]